MVKKILIGIGVIFLLAQFFQAKTNKVPQGTEHWDTLAEQHNISADAHSIMKRSCYDCHSNHTVYPWYSKITPVNHWMYSHIRVGKKQFNFDTLDSFDAKKRNHKLEEFIEEIEEDKMPIVQYTWTHFDSKLSDEEKEILVSWAKSAMQ